MTSNSNPQLDPFSDLEPFSKPALKEWGWVKCHVFPRGRLTVAVAAPRGYPAQMPYFSLHGLFALAIASRDDYDKIAGEILGDLMPALRTELEGPAACGAIHEDLIELHSHETMHVAITMKAAMLLLPRYLDREEYEFGGNVVQWLGQVCTDEAQTVTDIEALNELFDANHAARDASAQYVTDFAPPREDG